MQRVVALSEVSDVGREHAVPGRSGGACNTPKKLAIVKEYRTIGKGRQIVRRGDSRQVGGAAAVGHKKNVLLSAPAFHLSEHPDTNFSESARDQSEEGKWQSNFRLTLSN